MTDEERHETFAEQFAAFLATDKRSEEVRDDRGRLVSVVVDGQRFHRAPERGDLAPRGMPTLDDDGLAEIEHRAFGWSTEWDVRQMAGWDIPALVAEVRSLRGVVQALESALERTEWNFRLAVDGKPVRDMCENLAENESAFALAAAVPACNHGKTVAHRIAGDWPNWCRPSPAVLPEKPRLAAGCACGPDCDNEGPHE